MSEPRLTQHHDQVWLEYEHGSNTYEIPFDEGRYVGGAVLFNNTKSPALVKGMISPEPHLDKLEQQAKDGDPEAVAAYTMLEEYQYDALIAAGMTPAFATQRRDAD